MKLSSILLKILMPMVLGAAILYSMYRGEDWQQLRHVMTDETDWTWMLLSFPNPSFFGKYVKAHFGMTPAQFRLDHGDSMISRGDRDGNLFGRCSDTRILKALHRALPPASSCASSPCRPLGHSVML